LTVFRPRLEFTVPDDRWTVAAETTDIFELGRLDEAGEPLNGVYIDGTQVQVVFDPPCPVGSTKLINERPQALIEALQANEFISVSDPRPVSFAGYTGLQVDISYVKPVGDACGPVPEGEDENVLHLFPAGNGTFRLGPDPEDRVRLISIDVEGRPLTFIVGTYDLAGYPQFEQIAQPIVESISVTP
jgi:hypothetical protein